MARTLHEMAVKLQEYIIDQLSGSFGANRANLQRYNNLKLKMEIKDYPHIIIIIGISEVLYNLDTLQKIEGGLGTDEKFVRRWLGANSIIAELKEIYSSFEQSIREAKALAGKKEDQEKEQEGQAYEINFKKLEKKEEAKRNRSFFRHEKK